MDIEKQQDCMRVCYKHWENNNNEFRNAQEMSIITYAMLLNIINESNNTNENLEQCIERAKDLYQQGLQNGWMRTH
jgi:hypothetical protein